MAPKGRKRKTDAEKFWPKVDRRGDDECWPWIAGRTAGGYGLFWFTGPPRTATTAHRVSYELHGGTIPAGLEVDHLCRNTLCVNPTHLEPVTRHENEARKPRKTHCPQGHEYNEANSYVEKNGKYLHCRVCDNARHKARRNAA
jgi:hypothetical protein